MIPHGIKKIIRLIPATTKEINSLSFTSCIVSFVQNIFLNYLFDFLNLVILEFNDSFIMLDLNTESYSNNFTQKLRKKFNLKT